MVNSPDPGDSSEELRILECVPSDKSSGFFEDWEGMPEEIKRELNAIAAQVEIEYDLVTKRIHDYSLLGQFRPIKLRKNDVSPIDEEIVEKINRIMNDSDMQKKVEEVLKKMGIKKYCNCPWCRQQRIRAISDKVGPITI